MEKIAFLGLGRMGLPMARRLADAGHPLTVWNRSPGRADGLTEAAPGGGRAGCGRRRHHAVRP
ncbi:NAD(P)-dependent oxidoreductase [Kitasatospora sp. Ki12]